MPRRCLFISKLLGIFLVPSIASFAQTITPDDPGPGDVRLTIDSSLNQKAISPYIYGINSYAESSWNNPAKFDRNGGNRWTGYNWETNASNAGSDFFHFSDNFLVNFQANTPPGEAVRPSLVDAANNNRALLTTIPHAGYVSADTGGEVLVSETAPSARWHAVEAKKSTIYPGSSLSLTPNLNDGYVFTDEFVNWVEQTKQPGQEVFYALDNEPGLWAETHSRLHPAKATFAEVRANTIEHASAIKDVAPNAKTFGPVGYGWQGFFNLQNAPDATTAPTDEGAGELHFHEWLLQEVAAEEAIQGRILMDVLDLHWYPEARGGGVRIIENNSAPAVAAARVQAPRSLWDPTYQEDSWITNDVTQQPIQLLPRAQNDIDQFKPGTLLALTEYNYGGTNHISGGVAQADALGIFGQQGLFAASLWNLHGEANSQFASAAFNMYLNYDGQGSEFGDTSIEAGTDDIAESAVYASLDSEDPSRMIVVAINRTDALLDAAIEVTHDRRFDEAAIYQLTDAGAAPVAAGVVTLDLVNALLYEMPAMSVSTLVLTRFDDGDFNHDGQVETDDLDQWNANYGLTDALHNQGDANRDGSVDGSDLLRWQQSLGETGESAIKVVPEPTSVFLLLLLMPLVAWDRSFGHGSNG